MEGKKPLDYLFKILILIFLFPTFVLNNLQLLDKQNILQCLQLLRFGDKPDNRVSGQKLLWQQLKATSFEYEPKCQTYAKYRPYRTNNRLSCFYIFGGFLNKQIHVYLKFIFSYLRFLIYIPPRIYAIDVIIINEIKIKFVCVKIPVLCRNILKKRKQVHNVKRTAINCPTVLTGGTTIFPIFHPSFFSVISFLEVFNS